MSIRDGFLPFGPAHGDSVVPRTDDGSSEEIKLGTRVVIFDLRQDRLYVSHRNLANIRILCAVV